MTVAPWVQSFFGVSFQKRNYYIFVINYKTPWTIVPLKQRSRQFILFFSPFISFDTYFFLIFVMNYGKNRPGEICRASGNLFSLTFGIQICTLCLSKSPIKPTTEVCPHSIWKFSVGPAIMFLNQRSKWFVFPPFVSKPNA